MNDLTKTVLAVVIAGALLGAAAFTRPSPLSDARFSDQGELFFPAFVEPMSAQALEVIAFDASEASVRPFKVEMKDGRWVIPSHYNYPADARDNMAKAASAFIGLAKEQVVSDRATDHETLGVLAPDDAAAPLSGRGTRVTLRDGAGAELASLIIGKPAPDPAAPDASTASATRRYVRMPDRPRVYAVNFPTSFSTSFGDWVETDLLKLEGRLTNRLLVDRYEIDEVAGQKKPVERLILTRIIPEPVGADAAKWTLESSPGGPLGAGETIDQSVLDATLAAFNDLRIVGVRPKPPALAAALAGKASQVGQSDMIDLAARGFFVTGDGQFVANEGEVTLTAEDGVIYNIAFGEILVEQDPLDALQSPEADVDAPESPSPAQGVESRYALVRVTFDPSLFPEPTPPPAPPASPAPPAPSPEDQSEPDEATEAADPAADPANDLAQQEYQQAREQRDADIAAGEARAAALSRRFADWYYVIDASSFASLRPGRAQLVTAGESDAPDAATSAPVGPQQ